MAETIVKAPMDFAAEEREEFMELVRSEGQVDPYGLTARVEGAVRLVFRRDGEALLGVAGLKQPTPDRVARIGKKAKHPLDSQEFPYELGWVVVIQPARWKGHSEALLDAALNGVDTGVYATARANNRGSFAMLRGSGFVLVGERYESDEHTDGLRLFIRKKPSKYALFALTLRKAIWSNPLIRAVKRGYRRFLSQ